MLSFVPGQKLVRGIPSNLAPQTRTLALISNSAAAAEAFDLLEKLAAGDARQVPSLEAGRPRTLVLTW